MTLNLDRYQANAPYPKIREVRREERLAGLLGDGYCGGVSELTTVMQYAYHSLRLRKKFPELAEILRGIFYVETMHMELLGQCICKMGDNPQYDLRLEQERSVCWQASLVEYGVTADQMLLADIEGEKQAAAFYLQAAEETRQTEVSQLFLRLAEDETLHVRILTELYRKYFHR